jgi:hypothetical protein
VWNGDRTECAGYRSGRIIGRPPGDFHRGDCIRGFQAAWCIDPGFRVDHTLFFSLDPNIQRYDEAKTRDF